MTKILTLLIVLFLVIGLWFPRAFSFAMTPVSPEPQGAIDCLVNAVLTAFMLFIWSQIPYRKVKE